MENISKVAEFIDLRRKLETQLYDYEMNNLFGKIDRDDEYVEYVDAMRTLSLCLNLAGELIGLQPKPKRTLRDLIGLEDDEDDRRENK